MLYTKGNGGLQETGVVLPLPSTLPSVKWKPVDYLLQPSFPMFPYGLQEAPLTHTGKTLAVIQWKMRCS